MWSDDEMTEEYEEEAAGEGEGKRKERPTDRQRSEVSKVSVGDVSFLWVGVSNGSAVCPVYRSRLSRRRVPRRPPNPPRPRP